MRARVLATLAAVLAALALAACGNRHDPVLHGTNEGSYLDLGPMIYQVQISRPLNPGDAEDRSYLVGLRPEDRELSPHEDWFAVFVRVENLTDRPQQAADEYHIVDTAGTVFRPIELGPENVFAYRPQVIPAHGQIPALDTPAEQGSIQGALLLFKMPTRNLENRPLEFTIANEAVPGVEVSTELDV